MSSSLIVSHESTYQNVNCTLQCLRFSFKLLKHSSTTLRPSSSLYICWTNSGMQIYANVLKIFQQIPLSINVFVYLFTHRLWHIWLVFVVDCCVKHLYRRRPILKESMLFMKVTIRDTHAWSTSIHIFTFTNQGVLTFLPLFSKSMYLYLNCVLI